MHLCTQKILDIQVSITHNFSRETLCFTKHYVCCLKCGVNSLIATSINMVEYCYYRRLYKKKLSGDILTIAVLLQSQSRIITHKENYKKNLNSKIRVLFVY